MIVPGGLSLRRPRLEDAEDTLALMVRNDVAAYGEPDSDMEDLLHEWAQIDLQQDAWLVTRPDGQLAGYAAVLPWGSDVHYLFYTDPGWPGEELDKALLDLCLGRGPAFAQERGETTGTMARLFLAHVNRRQRQIAAAAGFRAGRYYFQMRIELTEPPPIAIWPAGIRLITAGEHSGDQAIYELIETAFYQPERRPSTFEQWREHMKRADIYDPELWFLAMHGADLVGACLSFPYPAGGWVRQLGVADYWRRKGLGTALLRHTFAAYRQRGFDNVGLSVESKRPDAHHFYQKVGMRQVRQYDEYVKELKPD